MRLPRHVPGAPTRARYGRSAALLAVGACATVLVGGGPAQATLRGFGVSRNDGKAVRLELDGGSAKGSFRIAGSVGGLYPGASATLVLTVVNPQHFAIDVTSLQTTVANAAPGCQASYFSVASFGGQLVVPADGSAHVSVAAVLSHAAPDACQDAVFPLTYSGIAKKV